MSLRAPLPVRTHHLAPGATGAGAAHPDLNLTVSDLDELRGLLRSLAAIAAGPLLPRDTSPEIRIRMVREELIVRIGGGGLRVISWESPIGGSPMTVERILDMVAPQRAEVAAAQETEPTDEEDFEMPDLPWFRIGLFSLAILAVNVVTVWMLLKEPPNFLPEYELMSAADSARLLRAVAGDYETGRRSGDRLLSISPTGYLRLAVYSSRHEIVEERTEVARGAIADKKPILITNTPTSIEIVDATTLVIYGNTYHRR